LFREKSLKKISILSKRLEGFNKVTYITEIGNPCSFTGGLDSWDDFNIPWVWKVNSTGDPHNELCLNVAMVPAQIQCGCVNMIDPAIWSDDGSLVVLEANVNVTAYENVLDNLSLPKVYRYDEVGNPISIYLFAQIDQGAPVPLNILAPNPPNENYDIGTGESINKYKQGEIFVRPGVELGALDKYMENSRTTFFYD